MVRINLLPPEIIERRRYERFYPRIFIGGAVLVGVIVVAWAAMGLFVGSKQANLQQMKQSTEQISGQAESFAIFEQQRQALEARTRTADAALVDRIDMGGLAEDISMILPEEVWVGNLLCNERTGMTLSGFTPARTSENNLTAGYKSVAATLVRLNSLPNITDVWLTTARSEVYNAFQEGSSDASTTVVAFDATAKITTATVGNE